jgi:CHRD domain
MNKIQTLIRCNRTVVYFALGLFACLALTGISTPVAASLGPAAPAQGSVPAMVSSTSLAAFEALAGHLETAESTLVAQGMSGSMMSYGAILRDRNVVPMAPSTSARGAVGAVLVGDRLVVRGSFKNLSSDLRNYATDPVNPPNPNITSAFHIHRGMSTENGPFQYALGVTLDPNGRGGMAMGEYTLTPEQVQALNSGMLYLDVHTTSNRAGELRGVLMPY